VFCSGNCVRTSAEGRPAKQGFAHMGVWVASRHVASGTSPGWARQTGLRPCVRSRSLSARCERCVRVLVLAGEQGCAHATAWARPATAWASCATVWLPVRPSRPPPVQPPGPGLPVRWRGPPMRRSGLPVRPSGPPMRRHMLRPRSGTCNPAPRHSGLAPAAIRAPLTAAIRARYPQPSGPCRPQPAWPCYP
jgi:hypothetical protein